MVKWYFAFLILLSGVLHSSDSALSISSLRYSIGGFQGVLSRQSRSVQVKAQLEQNFVLNARPTARDWNRTVQGLIFQANPRLEGLAHEKVSSLSREVVQTSQCYGIDPGIFSALIWRESNFKPHSTSDTGAIGLTQMTQAGVQEILERLVDSSPRRLKHLRALVQKCNPKIYETIPGAVSADVVAAWKNSAAYSNTSALVLGALLLKINLAHARGEGMKALYREALEKYNGDAKVKIQFATDVLQLDQQLNSPMQFALSDSKFLKSLGQF